MSQLVGRMAPEFALEGVLNGKFHTYRLSDYKGKWVVLFFYPLDFTFVCPTEILAFSDRLGEFREHLGGELTITLARHIGEGVEVHAIDESLMDDAIASLRP